MSFVRQRLRRLRMCQCTQRVQRAPPRGMQGQSGAFGGPADAQTPYLPLPMVRRASNTIAVALSLELGTGCEKHEYRGSSFALTRGEAQNRRPRGLQSMAALAGGTFSRRITHLSTP